MIEETRERPERAKKRIHIPAIGEPLLAPCPVTIIKDSLLVCVRVCVRAREKERKEEKPDQKKETRIG